MTTLSIPRGASFTSNKNRQPPAASHQQQQQQSQLQSVSQMFQLYETFRKQNFAISSNTLRPEDLTQSGNGSGVWTRGHAPGGVTGEAEPASPVFRFQDALSWAQRCVTGENNHKPTPTEHGCGGTDNSSVLCERFAELVNLIENARMEWKKIYPGQLTDVSVPFGVELLTPSNVGFDSLQPTPLVSQLDIQEMPSVPSIHLSSAENHPLDLGSQYWSPIGGIQVVDALPPAQANPDLSPQTQSTSKSQSSAMPKRGPALASSMAGNVLGLSTRSREKAALRISMADLAYAAAPRLPQPPVWGASEDNVDDQAAVPFPPGSARTKVKWAPDNESSGPSGGEKGDVSRSPRAEANVGQEAARPNPLRKTPSALKLTASPTKSMPVILTTPRSTPITDGETDFSNSCHSQSGSAAVARSWHPALGGTPSQGNLPPFLARNNTSNEFAAYLMASLRKVPTLQGTLMELDTGFTVIADFEVVAELGRGTYGTVSLGVDTEGEMFAIKTLHNGTRIARSASKKDAGRGMLSASNSLNAPRSPGLVPLISASEMEESAVDREIAVMKRLNHPNVVKLHAVIEDIKESQTHMVMQYIENGPPTKINRDGSCKPVPVPLALHYMTQVSTGLDYLHHCGIIHRDVKPENILTDKKFNAYVADFGVSSILADKRGVGLKSRAGTMAFMSPELIASASAAAEFGKEADIWAFGVTLYCMVFGKMPYYGRSAVELMRGISSDPVQFPESLPHVDRASIGSESWQIPEGEEEECYKSVRTLIERLLVKDPKGRMSLRAFRRHPYVQRYAVSTDGSADLQAETSDADSSMQDEGQTNHRMTDSDEAPLPTLAQVSDTPTKRLIENPRRVRENISEDELRCAVSRCCVGMYRKQCAASYEVHSLITGFVDRFRNRLRQRQVAGGAVL